MIQDWKKAHKMHSVQLAALIAVVAGLEPLIPELHGRLPDHWVSIAAVLVVVARLVRQKSLETPTLDEVWDEAMRAKERAKK